MKEINGQLDEEIWQESERLLFILDCKPWKYVNWLLFFLFHRQGKSFLLAVCVNKWKEWMIVCFGFQFLERAVFDLSISLSFCVLCLSISLSLGLSFSFFSPCSYLPFFCLKQLISFYTKRGSKRCFNVVKNYNLSLLNGVIALSNNIMYRFLKLHMSEF